MMSRRRWQQTLVGAGVSGLLAASVTLSWGQTSSDTQASAEAEGREFPQPEIQSSTRGILRTTMRARIATNKLVDQYSGEIRKVRTLTFDGTIPGPTLVVNPGDTLAIDLVNRLPANPEVQRMGAFPHDPYTINFHTHGLEVSPLGFSDNVFREMEPGTTHVVQVEIPRDHPSGTYWYHPHKHGAATLQMMGGMAGFLIVKGGRGTLDAVPEVKAAKDVVMGFQDILTDLSGDMPFVNEAATQFGTFPFGTTDPALQGVWSAYGLDGAPGRSNFYYTTNGVTNPTLRMRPGEVQRWRLLNATIGDNLVLALEGHGFNIIAMDGITVPKMYRLQPEAPIVLGPGQRIDFLVKAGKRGTYRLQSIDPGTSVSVSPSGIDPEPRASRHSFDFPPPCSPGPGVDCTGMLTYPFPLVTVIVDGNRKDMDLPSGRLPVPTNLPSVDTMLNTKPDAVRNVAFELCGTQTGMAMAGARLPSCGWYFAKYDATFWGGLPFNNLQMVRDADDTGMPSNPPNPQMPLVNFKKEALFDPEKPLFNNMIVGNYEEWTIINRSFSDHPFHIHQNPFLVTKINGQALAIPEWHDTIIVPGAVPQPNATSMGDINSADYGTITFRIHFSPITAGCFVMHCHIISHEDSSMMQRLDILPGENQPSGCAM